MVRMKLSKEEFDPKALDVNVDKSTFKRYRGEIPRNGTILIFRVTRMWWTQAKDGTSQIYLMAFAEQNKGQLKQYNGLPVREYLTFKPEAAFRYQNFLQNFGLTTRDIFNKMDVEPEPDSIGDVITSIGGWVVGSDDALCRIALVRDRYDPDELKAKVDRDGWLPLDEDDELDEDEDIDEDEDEDEDEEPAARPTTRVRGRSSQAGRQARSRSRDVPDDDEDDEDIEDEDEDDIDDEEEEAAEEEQEDEEQEDEEEAEDEEPPARPAHRSRDSGRTASKSRPAATGRRGTATSGRRDGERTRATSRASTARRDRTLGPRGAKGRDGGSREDPPF